MEGAHNAYLMHWVQTGLLSLIALLVFYGIFMKKCFQYYRDCGLDTMRDKLGFGCFLGCIGYLVCSFFSDSTLYTTPIFYVFAGIALAAADGEWKKCFSYEIQCVILWKLIELCAKSDEIGKGEKYYETCKDIKYQKITEHSKKRRMRWVPDFLPVSLQNFLYSRKPELWEQINLFRLSKQWMQTKDRSRSVRSFVR